MIRTPLFLGIVTALVLQSLNMNQTHGETPNILAVKGIPDPSLAYNMRVTNTESIASEATLNVDMPITGLIRANTISAEFPWRR